MRCIKLLAVVGEEPFCVHQLQFELLLVAGALVLVWAVFAGLLVPGTVQRWTVDAGRHVIPVTTYQHRA